MNKINKVNLRCRCIALPSPWRRKINNKLKHKKYNKHDMLCSCTVFPLSPLPLLPLAAQDKHSKKRNKVTKHG